eukprot:SRR837773.7868.p1 GENE.SRR837773.7868~~SRR837773.7868.p1  ORF type:complete len:229 (-),score=17.70 SRR837773.7868:107-751(-)
MSGALSVVKDKQSKRRRLRTLHCYFARTSLSAAAASAALPCRGLQLEVFELGGEESSRALEGVAGFGAVLAVPAEGPRADSTEDASVVERPEWRFVSFSDAAGWLREAVGPPPRRPLNEPDPSLALLFSGDLGIMCAVAGIFLLVSAFAVENGGQVVIVDETAEATLTLVDAAVGEFGKRVPSRTAWLVVWISALAGGALNIQHTVRSALLCGL